MSEMAAEQPMTSKQRGTELRIAAIAGAVPIAGLILFYSFVVRARLALGFWPSPYQPDPKDLGFPLHYNVAMCALGLILTSPAGFLPLAIRGLSSWDTIGRAVVIRAAAFLVVFSASIGLLIADPGRFLEWLLD